MARLSRCRLPALLDFRPADSRDMSLLGREGRRKKKKKKKTDQNVMTGRSFAHCSQTSTQMWHLIKGLNLTWVCELKYEMEIGSIMSILNKTDFFFVMSNQSHCEFHSDWKGKNLSDTSVEVILANLYIKARSDMAYYNKCNQLRAK